MVCENKNKFQDAVKGNIFKANRVITFTVLYSAKNIMTNQDLEGGSFF